MSVQIIYQELRKFTEFDEQISNDEKKSKQFFKVKIKSYQRRSSSRNSSYHITDIEHQETGDRSEII